MNFLLIKRQSVAPAPVLTLRGTEKITEASEEWWGIYYRGEKIGYASQTIEPKAKGYKLNDYSRLNLNLLGTVQPAETRLDMEANDDWILERFDFALNSKEIGFKARGAVTDNKLTLEIDSAGHRSTREITLTQAPYLLASLKPYVVTQQLETGKKFYFSTFDPSTLSQQVTTIVIEGREQIRIGNRLEPAIKMRQSFGGISVVSWVDVHGRTLKEESPAGMSMTRQSRQEAKNLPSRSVPLDMIAQASIPVADADRRRQSACGGRIETRRRQPGEFRPRRRTAETHRRPLGDNPRRSNQARRPRRFRSKSRDCKLSCSRPLSCSRIIRASRPSPRASSARKPTP